MTKKESKIVFALVENLEYLAYLKNSQDYSLQTLLICYLKEPLTFNLGKFSANMKKSSNGMFLHYIYCLEVAQKFCVLLSSRETIRY